MRWLPVIPALLGLVLVSIAPARASELPSSRLLLAGVERCIDSQFKAGEATDRTASIKLSKSCPVLARSRQHPLLKQIQPPLKDELSVSQLLDVRAILQSRSRAKPAASPAKYAYTGLETLLEETYIPNESFKPDPTLWQRFIEWLRDLLAPEDAEAPQWLEDFLDAIELPDEDTIMLFLKGAVALLVLLTLLMIFNELRAANILSAWRHIRRQRRASTQEPDFELQDDNLSLEAISRLPDRQFAGKLLVRTLKNLMQRGLLPARFSLTNRELLSRLDAKQQPLRSDLDRLFTDTDAGLYGERPLDPQQRQRMLQLSEQLNRTEGQA